MKLLRKNLMLQSKKGLDYYTLIIVLVGILILSFVVFSLFNKQLKLSSGLSIGTDQFRMLKTYSIAEKFLSFVDASARLALEQSAYSSGKSGFFYEGLDEEGELMKNPCGFNKGYTYWTKDVMSSRCEPQAVNCYPDSDQMKSTLRSFFGPVLGSFISNFNAQSQIKIPFDYEPFRVEPVVGGTELVGISKEPLVITVPNINYEVKPSFRESIPVEVIPNGEKVVGGAKQLARKDKGEIDRRLVEFSKDDGGKLKWNLDSYSNPVNSCTYQPGITCRYVCGEDCDDDGCWPIYCDGIIVRTVTYNDISALFSATEQNKLLTFNRLMNIPEFKDMEYDFGLAWFEPTSCVETCSGHEPRSCPVPPKAS